MERSAQGTKHHFLLAILSTIESSRLQKTFRVIKSNHHRGLLSREGGFTAASGLSPPRSPSVRAEDGSSLLSLPLASAADSCRPILMSSLNADGSPGYINAVFANVRLQLQQGLELLGAAEAPRAPLLHSGCLAAAGALLPGDGSHDQPKNPLPFTCWVLCISSGSAPGSAEPPSPALGIIEAA